MKINYSQELLKQYPDLLYGHLTVNVPENTKSNPRLEEEKRKTEKEIRENYTTPDPVVDLYQSHFKAWGTTYPIIYQIDSIQKDKKFPNVSTLVDAMFISELKTRTLTSGHDADELKGQLNFELANPGDTYVNLTGKNRTLKENDVILRDDEGILGSVLYGPSKRTTITNHITNALYIAWNPFGLNEDHVQGHLDDIKNNLSLVYPQLNSKSWISP